LKRHLERHHVDTWKRVVKADQAKTNETAASNAVCETKTLSKLFHCENVTMSLTKQNFQKHLIQLVEDNGIALTVLSSPAFTYLLKEMADKLGVCH